jgi:hypothetical protein
MANGHVDHLSDPDTWRSVLPGPVFEGLRTWADSQPFRIRHVRRLTAGRSGSYVAVIRLQPEHGRLQHAVLKLLPPQIGQDETHGVARAKQWTSEKFWYEHMVPTTRSEALPETDWWLHLQELGHANLAQLRPLIELIDAPQFADSCGAIVAAIVDDWHAAEDPEPFQCTARSFLAEFLTDAHRERIEAFTGRPDVGLELTVTGLELPGRKDRLPNPIALLGDARSGPAVVPGIDDLIDVYVANGHGDLQLYNILVPAVGPITPGQFWLIDYGRFTPETPVSRDPVKLLLASAASWLPALRPATGLRSNLAELVVDPTNHAAAAPVAGYLDVSKRIYEAASRWGERRSMPEEWRRQHLLVLIGSALRTVADADLADEDRWWFLEVAALGLHAYGEAGTDQQTRRLLPSTPPSLPPAVTALVDDSRAADPQPARPPRHDPAVRPSEATGRATAQLGSGSDPAPRPRPVPLARAGKRVLVKWLGHDWRMLADELGIPAYTQRRFGHGEEAYDIWDWLEVRGRLSDLPDALRAIDRSDLLGGMTDPTP